MTTKYLRLFFNHAASKKNKITTAKCEVCNILIKMVDDQLKDNAYKIIMKILSQYLIIASMYYIRREIKFNLCRFYEFSTMI